MSGSFQEDVLDFLKLHSEGYTEEDLRQTGNRALLLELLPERKNLIHWIPFTGKRVLQIGAGVGTLTAQMVQSGATVDAIEEDTASAAVITARMAEDAPLSVYTDGEAFLSACEEAYDWILLEEGMASETVRHLAQGGLAEFLQRLCGYLSDH